ncbi:MAG: DUF1616 domain-containing protein [Methanosarcinales archaeon]|nr:DUF1616 domain-containing protein [Methanosarcinales archaeon]
MKRQLLQSPWIDLYLVLATNALAILFILIPPFNETPLRIPLALVLLLFLPGYVFIAALFPGRDISGIERFTLSVGLSIAITVFDGFAISVTVWRFRPTSIVVSLTLIILFFMLITYFMRRRLPPEQRFVPDARPFIESLKTKEEMTDIEKALVIAMVGSIIIASGMLIYAKLTFEPEQFTALYILGPGGKAEGYQTNLSFGETTTALVGIENYEHARVNYTLQVVLGGVVLTEREVRLGHNEKWVENVTYVPYVIGEKIKLEFLLFKEGNEGTYRSVHLWVNSQIDKNNSGGIESYLVSVPQVINGNMEDNSGWMFSGSPVFTGNYSNKTWISKSRSYQVNIFKGENGQTVRQGYFGAVYQDINASREGPAVLAFNVKDSDASRTEGNYLKQVLFNNKVIWEEDTAGDEGWQHVESLVRLSGTNRIMLRVNAQKSLQNQSMSVWWDDIQLKTLTNLSIRNWNSNVTLGVPTTITVAVENYETDFTDYTLEIRLDGVPVSSQRFWLAGREDRVEDISFVPEAVGPDIKLEAVLYRGDDEEPYRIDGVLIVSSIDYDDLAAVLDYAITPPELFNGNMEYSSIWQFTGFNFSGNYTDVTSRSPVLSFEMRQGPDNYSGAGDFGAAYQYVNGSAKGLALLVFDVKDSITSGRTGYHTKQVLLNDRVVWEDDAAGNEGWEHVEVPVMLLRNNRIELMVRELQGNPDRVQVWWDDVAFASFFDKNLSGVKTGGSGSELEIRGNVLSTKAGQTVTISSGDYSDLYSTEDLSFYFTSDGTVGVGDGVYITRASSGSIWYKGEKYYSVNPLKADTLTDIIINSGSKTMKAGDTWVLENGYNITILSIDGFDGSAVLELRRNGLVITTETLSFDEIFEYRTTASGINNYKMLTLKVGSISPESVRITNLYLYSDAPRQVSIGDRYGEFQVDDIQADRIIFTNPATIELTNPTSLLDNRVRFKVADDRERAYAYTIKTKPGTYRVKGSSYNVGAGHWMNLSGETFRPFGYDLDSGTSYEALNMYFTNDNYVKIGDATYRATLSSGEIGFLGGVYAPVGKNKVDLLSRILVHDDEKSLRLREPYLLKDGYILTFWDITNDGALLELTKNGVMVDSDIFPQGRTVAFTSVYGNEEITFFECKIESIIGERILFKDIRQYSQTPVQLSLGKRYGDFKVTEMTGNGVVMENAEPITIDDEYTLLDNWIRFDVSGTSATPYVEVILQ